AIFGEFAEDGFEIHLPIARGTIAACTFQPALVAAKCALLTSFIELSVFYVEGFNPFVIEIDILDIIELLQYKMRGIVKQAGTRVLLYFFEEHFVGNTIK